jgi:hypothetical protein
MFDNFLLIPVSPAKLSIIQLFLREKVFVLFFRIVKTNFLWQRLGFSLACNLVL